MKQFTIYQSVLQTIINIVIIIVSIFLEIPIIYILSMSNISVMIIAILIHKIQKKSHIAHNLDTSFNMDRSDYSVIDIL